MAMAVKGRSVEFSAAPGRQGPGSLRSCKTYGNLPFQMSDAPQNSTWPQHFGSVQNSLPVVCSIFDPGWVKLRAVQTGQRGIRIMTTRITRLLTIWRRSTWPSDARKQISTRTGPSSAYQVLRKVECLGTGSTVA
eukprot:s977_g15.t1